MCYECKILFRNQRYGKDNLNTQYSSTDPLNFGESTDSLMTGTLNIAAPEVIKHKGQYYLTSLLPTLDGIRMVKLEFVEK